MHPKLLEILTKKEVPIDNEQLVRYLSGELDDDKRHDMEEELESGHAMEADALEGWMQAADSRKMLRHAEEINRQLNRQLETSHGKKRKRPISEMPVTWWVFGLVFVLIIIAWVIISLLS